MIPVMLAAVPVLLVSVWPGLWLGLMEGAGHVPSGAARPVLRDVALASPMARPCSIRGGCACWWRWWGVRSCCCAGWPAPCLPGRWRDGSRARPPFRHGWCLVTR
ncbi:hypothetical protein RAA17_20235 [Komagataeibacter rhaeticus]|nr:hypothetical protein [Komagataeibacter rhaeticus]